MSGHVTGKSSFSQPDCGMRSHNLARFAVSSSVTFTQRRKTSASKVLASATLQVFASAASKALKSFCRDGVCIHPFQEQAEKALRRSYRALTVWRLRLPDFWRFKPIFWELYFIQLIRPHKRIFGLRSDQYPLINAQALITRKSLYVRCHEPLFNI